MFLLTVSVSGRTQTAKMVIAVCGVTLCLALIVIMSWFAGISYERHSGDVGHGFVLF